MNNSFQLFRHPVKLVPPELLLLPAGAIMLPGNPFFVANLHIDKQIIYEFYLGFLIYYSKGSALSINDSIVFFFF